MVKNLAWVLALLLGLTSFARAQALPPLSTAEQSAIAQGVDATAPPADPGFDALFNHVLSWDNQMKLWSAGVDRPRDFVQPAWIDGILEGTVPADIGTDALLFGRLIERGPAPRRALMERWVIEPLDTDAPGQTGHHPIVLYVVRPVSAILGEPEPGWYVRAAARYAGIAEIPDIPRLSEAPSDNRYAAFIGATFDVSQRSGDSPAGAFAWIGLTIAVIIGVGVLIVMTIQRARHPNVLPRRAPDPAGPKEPTDAR